MPYRIVQNVDGQMVVTEPADVLAWAEAAGFTFAGLNQNFRQRAELQGKPVFRELCGPMWDGNGWIRYEDQRANDQLSA
jgi:hypothetical protein